MMKTPKKLTNAEIEERLTAAGIKPTAQRIAICQFVLSSDTHPTVDEVKAWVDQNFPKMSLATVYNTLNSLVEANLMQALRFPHEDKLMFDNNTKVHYHFLDEETGEVVDVEAHRLDVDMKLGPEFTVDSVDILLKGHRSKKGK